MARLETDLDRLKNLYGDSDCRMKEEIVIFQFVGKVQPWSQAYSAAQTMLKRLEKRGDPRDVSLGISKPILEEIIPDAEFVDIQPQ